MKWKGCGNHSCKTHLSPSNIQFLGVMIKCSDCQEQNWAEGATVSMHIACPSPVPPTIPESLQQSYEARGCPGPSDNWQKQDRDVGQCAWTNSSTVETRIKVSWLPAPWRCVVKKFRPQILSITPHASPHPHPLDYLHEGKKQCTE